MTPEALQAISLAVAEERRVDAVLDLIVRGLSEQRGVALVRLWLTGPGDLCAACPLAEECRDRSRCLHLAASRGTPTRRGEDWSGTAGRFRRVPLHARKVGLVGATGKPLLIDLARDGAAWVADPSWAAREGIVSFAAQPLVFRGEVLGVLAVFGREPLGQEQLGWLRTFADHAAVALANGRAFEEIERLRGRLEQENEYLREEVRAGQAQLELVGQSPALVQALEQAALVAPTGASVLIQGETGTGKELIARAIHEQSPRRARPLVRVNCAAVPRELFESEFFGHARGAFTGALRERAGRFQLADGGTLFLDEVGEIPLELQGKLLRAVQEGTFERVGEDRTRRVDARIVAATNRELEAEVRAGRFRQDLFFRLSVFPLRVPPLRERKEDLPALAEHFLGQACRRLGVEPPRLAASDLRALAAHDWPGNVRELQNVLERAAIRSRGRSLQLELTMATEGPQRAEETPILTEAQLRRRERDNTLAALERCAWRVHGPDGAARLLGLKPTTLLSRMKAMGIARPG